MYRLIILSALNSFRCYNRFVLSSLNNSILKPLDYKKRRSVLRLYKACLMFKEPLQCNGVTFENEWGFLYQDMNCDLL